MAATDKMAMTREQMEALGAVITGNVGKAKVLTTADYDYPEENPTSINTEALEPGVYIIGEEGVVFRYTTETTQGYALNTLFIWFGGQKYIYGSPNAPFISYGRSGDARIIPTPVVDDLVHSWSDDALSANQGKVLKDLVDSLAIRGTGAPTASTVGSVGTLYEDTTNGDLYICTDATNPYVWEEVGGGPTVVQTTGTSTTDVMSQNASTNLVMQDNSTQKIRLGTGGFGDYGSGFAVNANISNSQNIGIMSGAGSNTQSIAIGYNITDTTSGTQMGAIALGHGASLGRTGEMNIGSSSTTYGFNNSNYRLLSGLYDPQSAHDAATKGYVDTQVSAIGAGTRKATSTGWDTSNALNYVLKAASGVNAPAGAMFYAGNNVSDYPVYSGIGVYSADTSAEITPYLLVQQVSDDGSGRTVGNTASYQIALHSEIPAAFTTNEWNALWA